MSCHKLNIKYLPETHVSSFIDKICIIYNFIFWDSFYFISIKCNVIEVILTFRIIVAYCGCYYFSRFFLEYKCTFCFTLEECWWQNICNCLNYVRKYIWTWVEMCYWIRINRNFNLHCFTSDFVYEWWSCSFNSTLEWCWDWWIS